MVRGNQIAFPVSVALFDRRRQSRAFQQNAQVGDFGQIVCRYRHHEKASLFHGINEAFTGEPVQGLAQCGHAGLVPLFQAIKFQLTTRSQIAKNNVSLDAQVRFRADGGADFFQIPTFPKPQLFKPRLASQQRKAGHRCNKSRNWGDKFIGKAAIRAIAPRFCASWLGFNNENERGPRWRGGEEAMKR